MHGHDRLDAVSLAAGDDKALRQAEREAIPEFMKFNIVESEVQNVVWKESNRDKNSCSPLSKFPEKLRSNVILKKKKT